MNKNTLYVGLAYTALGAALLAAAFLGEYAYEALLWGFGGGSMGSGLATLWRYFYWTRPANTAKYHSRRTNISFSKLIAKRNHNYCRHSHWNSSHNT